MKQLNVRFCLSRRKAYVFIKITVGPQVGLFHWIDRQHFNKSASRWRQVEHSSNWDWRRKEEYTDVTLVEEDNKPEEGEEVELRRCESPSRRARTRTTRTSIIGKEIKEGRVVQQGKDFEGISKSFFERPKYTGRRRGEGKRMKGLAGKRNRVCREVGAWEKSKARG